MSFYMWTESILCDYSRPQHRQLKIHVLTWTPPPRAEQKRYYPNCQGIQYEKVEGIRRGLHEGEMNFSFKDAVSIWVNEGGFMKLQHTGVILLLAATKSESPAISCPWALWILIIGTHQLAVENESICNECGLNIGLSPVKRIPFQANA